MKLEKTVIFLSQKPTRDHARVLQIRAWVSGSSRSIGEFVCTGRHSPVQPLWLCLLTSAPCCRRSLAQSRWPRVTARWRGVRPRGSTHSKSICTTKRRTRKKWRHGNKCTDISIYLSIIYKLHSTVLPKLMMYCFLFIIISCWLFCWFVLS